MNLSHEKFRFFRESGWMVIATTVAGVFMYAVHWVAFKAMTKPEYGDLQNMLGLLNLGMIPAIALQTGLMQQTASAVTPDQRARLRGTVKQLLGWIFLIWLVGCGAAFFGRDAIFRVQKLSGWSLWMTVLTLLPLWWLPVMQGLLQGSQNFLWLGWSAMCNGMGRFLFVVIMLLLFRSGPAGTIFGAALGISLATVIAAWKSRDLWQGPTPKVNIALWIKEILPLTIGLGASQFMMSADILVVKSFFTKDETGLYGAAGTIARGLVLFTGPVVAVMFPRIVQSAARSEKTSVLGQTLLIAGGLGAGAALFCTLFPDFFFRVMNKPDYYPVAPLVPWFTWCMVPLALANVLISNLLARARFKVLPFLVILAVIYWFLLVAFGKYYRTANVLLDLKHIIQILGVFNLLFFVILVAVTFSKGQQGQK